MLSGAGLAVNYPNLFFVLYRIDGVDYRAAETLAFQFGDTHNRRTARRADGIFHHPGMLSRRKLNLPVPTTIWLTMR